jgi:hypothetical protein
VRWPVRLRLTERSLSPALCGLLRPAILLPKSLATDLSQAQLRAVLLHELMHLRRGDVLISILQALLQIVYWWHPLVWVANARIRRLREEAVDDCVMVALQNDADCYPSALLEVAKVTFHRPFATLGLVGILESKHSLRKRIERLANLNTPSKAGLTCFSIAAICAFAAVAVPMGAPPSKPTKILVAASDTIHITDSPPIERKESERQTPLSQNLFNGLRDRSSDPYIISLDMNSDAKTINSSAHKTQSANANIQLSIPRDQQPKWEIEGLSANAVVEQSIYSQLTAMGGVRVAYNGTVLTAERLELDQELGEALATGHVSIQCDGRVWTGENIRYNFKTREIEVRQSEAGAPLSKLEPLKEASKAKAEPYSTRELIDPSTGLSGSELLSGIPSNTAPLFTRSFRLDPATVREGLDIRIHSGSPPGIQPDSIGVDFDIAAGLRKVFLDAGISLGPPKSLAWSEAQGNLIVRTTQQELDIIEQILQLVCITPPQISIKLKVVEVDDATMAYVMNWMAAQDSGSTITAGHGKLGREIKNAVTSFTNTISFFVEGVVHSQQMPEITRSLEQKGAREILPPASVTTLSGRQTEFQATKTFSMIDWQPGIPSLATNLFRTRPVTVGPVVDIVPYVSTNGYDIELTVMSIDKEFLGYDDPGGFLGKQGVDQNTSSVLPVPHFRLRQVMTSRLVPDGHTLILGGIAEDSDVVQLKELRDKVPVLGDLPLLGRFFRSESESPSKKNLLFFITPVMIDPAGNPIH